MLVHQLNDRRRPKRAGVDPYQARCFRVYRVNNCQGAQPKRAQDHLNRNEGLLAVRDKPAAAGVPVLHGGAAAPDIFEALQANIQRTLLVLQGRDRKPDAHLVRKTLPPRAHQGKRPQAD